mmetsp:Transcript_45070/g.141283  ORF Transcript_45070/g.141283 Transcript_45070/m.141283 type:complete len:478 (+) Transcript_45070:1291-2724(+)
MVAVVPRLSMGPAVPPRDEDHLVLTPEQDRGVYQHGAVPAALGLDGQAHVGEAAVDPVDCGEAGSEFGIRDNVVQGQQQHHDRHRHKQQGLVVAHPPEQLLCWLLYQVHEDDGHRSQETEKQEANLVLGPDVPADELVHIHRVRVALQEIEARCPCGHLGLEAWEPSQAEQNHGLEGQQDGEARGELGSRRSRQGAREDQPEPQVPQRRHDLHQPPHRLVPGLHEPAEPGQQHAQHEDVGEGEGVELEEHHREVDRAVAAAEDVVPVPVEVLPREDREQDGQPRQEAQRQHRRDDKGGGHPGHQAVEKPEERPVEDQAAEEPALHVQRLLGVAWEPRLEEPSLQHQDEVARGRALRLGHEEGQQKAHGVERVDVDRAPEHVVEARLRVGPPLLRAEEDEAREHEEPRHPGEAPAEGGEVRDGRPRVEVPRDDVRGGYAAREAEGKPVGGRGGLRPGLQSGLGLRSVAALQEVLLLLA